MADQKTDNMSLRWYNVGDWKPYYLGFVNYGKRAKSANSDIRLLAATIQQYIQLLTRRPECELPRAPEKGTVHDMILLIRRANNLLGGRLLKDNVIREHLPYNDPAYESHIIYPAQVFRVRNQFLKDCADTALRICTTCIHHADNGFLGYYTEKFKNDVWPGFKQIQKKIAIDLLGLPVEQVDVPGFLLDPAVHLANYSPEAYDVSLEEYWVPSGVPRLTPDGWSFITRGIAADDIPECPEFPTSDPLLAAGGTRQGPNSQLSTATTSAVINGGTTGASQFNLDG